MNLKISKPSFELTYRLYFCYHSVYRDRVPTRKGWSRARRKRFNEFAQQNQWNNIMEFGDQVYEHPENDKLETELNA